MASFRAASDSHGKPGNRSESKRIGALLDLSRGELPPPSMNRFAYRGVDNSRLAVSKAQPSRIPQNPSTRKPASQNTSIRPALTHETQSWSTNASSGRPRASPAATTTVPRPDWPEQSRNLLRRKQSGLTQEPPSLRVKTRSDSGRTDSSSSSVPRSQASRDPSVSCSDRSMTESPVEIRNAQKVDLPRPAMQPPRVYPELDRYRDVQLPPPRDWLGKDIPFRLATEDLPPPTPLFSGTSSHSQLSTFSASPSTRFSESPGPSPYSRDTTPTSMSSQSPGLVAPMRLPTSRVKQASPAETRPPVTRRRAGSTPNESDSFSTDSQGLAAVREALTSSSSNSTVRVEERKEKKKRGRSPGPPNPPPRKSSQKFKKGQNPDEAAPPSKVPRIPGQLVMRSPSPTKSSRPSYERAQDATSQSRPPMPSRPSRDGTPDLYSQFGGPVPIIHSNISATGVADKRQSSQLGLSSLPKSTTPSSTQEQSRSLKAPSREPTPAPSGNPTKPQPSKAETGRTTRTPSPGVSTFKSRFPLFGRRAKTTTETTQADKKDKLPRKGPVAGTGHEGYGRVGAIKKRSSLVSQFSRALSSEALGNAHSTDPFLLERMNPVIIAGGEVIENRNTNPELGRTESNQSVALSRPSVHSRNNSSGSISSRDDRHTLWPPTTRSRRPSDSSDAESTKVKPTIALRRSTRRLRSSERPAVNMPKPIDTRGMSSPSAASLATTILTDDSVPDSRAESIHGQKERATAPKKLTKKAKSPRKWNLFSRSQTALTTKKPVEASVSAAVQPTQSKPVAFYTMMDSSEQEDTEEPDTEAVSRKSEDIRTQGTYTSAPVHAPAFSPPQQHIPTVEKTIANALPVQTQPEPKLERQPAQAKNLTSTGRPSRLPQVGRIPKVVKTRREQTSPKSFSRPFNRISLHAPPPQFGLIDQKSVAKGPSPPRSFSPEPTREESKETKSALSPPNEHTQQHPGLSPDLGHLGNEFFAFSPGKNSQYTPSTESSNFGMARYSNHVAVLPEPTAPLGEDEIWDEYNDLLGDVPPSATSSRGFPFHLETDESEPAKQPTRPLMSPTIKTLPSINIRDSVETGKSLSSHYSADMTARLNAAFKFGSDQPTTPFSVSEFVSGYGDRNNSNMELNKSPNPSTRCSSCSSQSAKTGASNKRSSGSSRNSESPLSQVNLRVGSMTVSKWLTFGHVLFSPVREELLNPDGSPKRHSILVIDGLGNDDWSFYAAETYPGATFYNLSPRAPVPKEQQSASSFPLSPPNHHQIQFTSHMDKLPFGPDSFTLVVFRFPSAAPESHYRNIISEACRVLKPGGYIELSILDVDLNNMGNQTRRSVRLLKESIHAWNPNLNLSSAADLTLRLLGKKGFSDVKTCRVGVPVASSITRSSSGNKKKDERSLAEMMNDKTEMGDENITKMVSKVGRWWYNRCYEVPPGMSKSIWSNKALLAECEEWGTSLKLMVCYARIPEARGRVASL